MERRPVPPSQRGFSLIEITIGIVLLGILFVSGANMLTGSLSSARLSNRAHAQAADARYAIERLSREIRGTQLNSGGASFDISTATPTHLAFVKASATTPVNVDIQWVGAALTLGYPPTTPNGVLIDHVSAFTLDYKDADMLSTQDIALIRYVAITLTRTAPSAPQTTWRTLIALRGA